MFKKILSSILRIGVVLFFALVMLVIHSNVLACLNYVIRIEALLRNLLMLQYLITENILLIV